MQSLPREESDMTFPKVTHYPKELNVKGETYAVVFRRKLDCLGKCDPEKRTIYIKTGLGPKETFRTFVHEVLHALEFEYELKIKHSLVYELEAAITDTLLLNF
jgi:hypothetical protein